MNNQFILNIAVFIVAILSAPIAFESVNAQTDNNLTEHDMIVSNETFTSALYLFAVPESIGGYGVYEAKAIDVFDVKLQLLLT